MFNKALMVRGLLNRSVVGLQRTYHGGYQKPQTMDDMPAPEGDWHELNSRRQAKYNAYLVTGILMLAGAIGLAKSSGLIHLNYSPPKSID